MTIFVFCHGSGENVVIEPLNSIERLFHSRCFYSSLKESTGVTNNINKGGGLGG